MDVPNERKPEIICAVQVRRLVRLVNYRGRFKKDGSLTTGIVEGGKREEDKENAPVPFMGERMKEGRKGGKAHHSKAR